MLRRTQHTECQSILLSSLPPVPCRYESWCKAPLEGGKPIECVPLFEDGEGGAEGSYFVKSQWCACCALCAPKHARRQVVEYLATSA